MLRFSITTRNFFSRSFTTTQSIHNAPFPLGFRATGVRCGQKKKQGMLDLALLESSQKCNAAAIFTTNKFQAAPVVISRDILQTCPDNVWGAVINSGCANACTGLKGIGDAEAMRYEAGQQGITNALIMSTGVIGEFLKMDCIREGIQGAAKQLTSDSAGWIKASKAIMTTDTFNKLVAQSFNSNGEKIADFSNPNSISRNLSPAFSIAGLCKGAGMIHPNMATMLCTILTDVNIHYKALDKALRYAADRSFHCISIDGDTSTNDTLAVLANGMSSSFPAITPIDSDAENPHYLRFRSALTDVAIELAQNIVKDGEGATKFVTVTVKNASSFQAARQIASSVCKSALVKTALYGQDANWGRILAAVGYSGVNFDPQKVGLRFLGDNESSSDETKSSITEKTVTLVEKGRPLPYDIPQADRLLKRKNIKILIDMGEEVNTEPATYWTCDFSIDYVKINADYRS